MNETSDKPADSSRSPIFTLGAANLAAQAISFAAVPIIARLYSPSEYGVFLGAMALASLVVPIASYRFNVALTVSSEVGVARHLWLVGHAILAGVGAIGGLMAVWLTLGVPDWQWNDAVAPTYLSLFVVAAIVAQGAAQLAQAWATRAGYFSALAGARVVEAVFDRTIAIAFGLWGAATALWLILGRVVGPAAGAALLHLKWRGQGAPHAYSYNHREVLKTARTHLAFTTYSGAASVVDQASRQIPLLVLGWSYSASVVGYFGLALQTIGIPMMVLAEAIAAVFLRRAASVRGSSKKLARVTEDVMVLSVAAGMPFAIIIAFLGQPLFILAFGHGWTEAGQFTQVLSWALLAMFVHRPTSTLFDVLGLQRARLVQDALLLLGRVAAFALVAGGGGDVVVAVAGWGVTTTVVYTAGLVYLCHAAGVAWPDLMLRMSGVVLTYAPTAVALMLLTSGDLDLLSSAAAGACGGLLQAAMSSVLKRIVGPTASASGLI